MSGGRFLTPQEQVKHCEDKGIQFNGISKTKAISYLEDNNNYFKLRSFRKNFVKDSNLNKYTTLDFADLIDLAIIDNRLRKILLEMALSIEHFSKVELLGILQKEESDGYIIIHDYYAQLSEHQRKILDKDLQKNSSSTYCSNLYKKYLSEDINKCPVWVFLEIISFGQYLHFYNFCINRLPAKYKDLELKMYLMWTVKDLRNACAHNNCIINDLRSPIPKGKKMNFNLSQALSYIGISNSRLRKHTKRAPFYQIVTTMYAHTLIVSSPGVHNKISRDLREFSQRLFRDRDYKSCDTIRSTFDLFILIIDNWFNLV